MAYAIAFEPEQKLIRVTAEGSENMAIALDAMRDLRTDQRFQPDYRILCDLRRQTFTANDAELAGLGIVLEKLFAGQRIAFVRLDSRGYDAQRVVIAVAENKVDAMVFTDYAEAENWLMGEGCQDRR